MSREISTLKSGALSAGTRSTGFPEKTCERAGGAAIGFFPCSLWPPSSFVGIISQPQPQPRIIKRQQLHHFLPAGRLREPRVRERARQEHAKRAAEGKKRKRERESRRFRKEEGERGGGCSVRKDVENGKQKKTEKKKPTSDFDPPPPPKKKTQRP